MKPSLYFPVRLLAFWLLFFGIFRLWFIAWFHDEWSPQTPLSVWKAFWYALPLDLSMASYLLLIPVLLWFIGVAIGQIAWRYFSLVIAGFNILLISAFILIFGANIFLYEEWHTPLNNRAMEYFKTPAALLDSMSVTFIILSIGLTLIFGWAWWRVYRRMTGAQLYPAAPVRWSLALLPLFIGLLLLGARGGTGVMAINESAVYYSPHLFDNHAATNTGWQLIHSLIETRSTENHFQFMDRGTAEATVSKLFQQMPSDDSQLNLLDRPDTTTRLNVVFIGMESMTAQVVEELGGEKGLCPNLSRLIRAGILFEHCYGSGYRTDQGLVSILGGYPAQPDQSIVLLSDKANKLSSVPKVLQRDGYATAFFYGGELTFANIGMWMRNQRFEKIFAESDFTSAEHTQRWGVDDHILLQRMALEISKLPQPFFAMGMTLSLHPPFDVPYESKWKTGNSDPELFRHSTAFADYALGEFFKTAEQQPWYANTVFVLVADHGASNPDQVRMDDPRSRHIPLIIFGAPLQQSSHGLRIPIYCNHHDIPAIVLRLLGKQYVQKEFPWSRNVWENSVSVSPNNGFAYYTNENGIGWTNQQGTGFYHFQDKSWQFFNGALDTIAQTQAKAYLQVLYDDFLSK